MYSSLGDDLPVKQSRYGVLGQDSALVRLSWARDKLLPETFIKTALWTEFIFLLFLCNAQLGNIHALNKVQHLIDHVTPLFFLYFLESTILFF